MWLCIEKTEHNGIFVLASDESLPDKGREVDSVCNNYRRRITATIVQSIFFSEATRKKKHNEMERIPLNPRHRTEGQNLVEFWSVRIKDEINVPIFKEKNWSE